MTSGVIQARDLTKSFPGNKVAVTDLSFEVRPGAVYGLIGRNGSGKTTTLRLLLGLLRPDSGEARVLGWDFWQAPRAVRSRAAYVCQNQHPPETKSLAQLSWCLERCNERWDAAHARRLAAQWSLPWDSPLGCLSSGRQRQAAILLAFAVRPEVLILDEPAAGLDPVLRRQLLTQLVEALHQNDGCTVLLSTHLVGDLERLADFIGIMDSGRMALSLPLDTILCQFKRVQLIFECENPPADLALPGMVSPPQRSGSVLNAVVRWTHDGEADSLRQWADARVQVFPMGLEEIFIALFGDRPAKAGVEAPEWALPRWE
jgi:ABC-2 type transport system ATP-binding protein